MILAGANNNSMLFTLHRAKAPTKEQERPQTPPNPKGKPKAKKANTQGQPKAKNQRAQTPKGQPKAKTANTQEGKAQAQARAVIMWRASMLMLKLKQFLGSHLYHQASN
jgi:hypothetical protein